MSRLANNWRYRDIYAVIIGNPENRRIQFFQRALAQLSLPLATVVSYADLIADRVSLPEIVRANAIVRIESPGEDFNVERAILMLGSEQPDNERDYISIDRSALNSMEFEPGRILYNRQWYRGFCQLLDIIKGQLQMCSHHRLMNRPADIALMFDKIGCQAELAAHRLPVPRSLGRIDSFEDLIDRMETSRCHRVFIKLAHSSSASGIVAYQTDGRRHRAVTTIEMVRREGQIALYNSLRVRCYDDLQEIATLVDTLTRDRVYVEQWLPKAGFDDCRFDLRVVVIKGQSCHTVVRMSKTPFTNLHLLNTRGDLQALQARMGSAAFEAATDICERAMALFPESLYGGIDLLIAPGFRRFAVLEINAFGDLLPNILHNNCDTYTAEILAMLSLSHQVSTQY
ncbi:MAG: STM4014 family protein [Acidobacteriota bacterium]